MYLHHSEKLYLFCGQKDPKNIRRKTAPISDYRKCAQTRVCRSAVLTHTHPAILWSFVEHMAKNFHIHKSINLVAQEVKVLGVKLPEIFYTHTHHIMHAAVHRLPPPLHS